MPLDEVGREQARSAARHLAQLHPNRIVASDLQRASATAQELADQVGLAVELDAGLRELSAGTWEGLRSGDLAEDPDYQAWARGENVAAGGAETREEVAERAIGVVDRVVAELPSDSLAVLVTHGGTIRGIVGRALGLPYEHWRVFGGMGNCCWSILEESGSRWRLSEHNAGSLPALVLGDDR